MQENTPVVIYNPNNVLFKHELWVNDKSKFNLPNTLEEVELKATRLLGMFIFKKSANKAIQKYHQSKAYEVELGKMKK